MYTDDIIVITLVKGYIGDTKTYNHSSSTLILPHKYLQYILVWVIHYHSLLRRLKKCSSPNYVSIITSRHMHPSYTKCFRWLTAYYFIYYPLHNKVVTITWWQVTSYTSFIYSQINWKWMQFIVTKLPLATWIAMFMLLSSAYLLLAMTKVLFLMLFSNY